MRAACVRNVGNGGDNKVKVNVRFWAYWFPEINRFDAPKAACDGILRQDQLSYAVYYILFLAPMMAAYWALFSDAPAVYFLIANIVFNLIAASAALAVHRKRIRESLRRQLRDEGTFLCIPCGYDLEGNESGVCPECGEAVEVTA